MIADESLLKRVAAAMRLPSPDAGEDDAPSLLAVTSESYGLIPGLADPGGGDGFDSAAAAFFEAVVESAYLVANADGVFDEAEQRAFREVVATACGGKVHDRQIQALVTDLREALVEEGCERRIAMVARCVHGPEQATEVLRVAALIALVSGGVSEEERLVLLRLAAGVGLGSREVDLAIAEAGRTIGVTPGPSVG
ncbi:MAG: TerB family tellurite resistance protein [Polyangiaceae bacterium]|nr:TerB family tellurite resistance protein [Polyangiaceae bacterium]